MSKPTNYDDVQNVMLVVVFNVEVREEGEELKYQPIRIEARADVKTTEGANKLATKFLDVGALVDEPLTKKEIYTKVKSFNTPLANLLKDLVLEELEEDISQ